jgi:4-hydroxy-tetrahydrodipicolinate synthase
VKLAEKAGADIVLLSYPSNFWPTTEQEIYDYTKAFCDATGLAVMLFPIPLWGFERVHPMGMSVELIGRLIADCPNVVAVKSEQGFPLISGLMEMYHHYRDQVIISCPIEGDCIPLMSLMDLQFSGTSYTQWMGDYFPKAFQLAREGKWEEAMKLYWQVQPARLASGGATAAYMPGVNFINRTNWKYMDWLAGFNGGPLRAPTPRMPDRFMGSLRAGLKASGCPVTDLPDSEFMKGLLARPCQAGSMPPEAIANGPIWTRASRSAVTPNSTMSTASPLKPSKTSATAGVTNSYLAHPAAGSCPSLIEP